MSIDVERLRRESRERAQSRPRLPFDGSVHDEELAGVPVRRYEPEEHGERVVGFLHGGYGLFGDLDGQDGYCRLLAAGLSATVVSIAYTLAPEGTLDEAAADTAAVVEQLSPRVLLCGDSAGGAVALRTARTTPLDGLLLTNPNVDLSLSRFDDAAPGGPDRATAAWSFARWAPDSPDLALDQPDTRLFVAVGDQDALLPDARHLVEHARRAELLILPGRSHGFVSDRETAVEVIAAMTRFLDD